MKKNTGLGNELAVLPARTKRCRTIGIVILKLTAWRLPQLKVFVGAWVPSNVVLPITADCRLMKYSNSTFVR